MNWTEKYEGYMARAREMIAAGDALNAQIMDLRRNPANIDDLIYSGYLTAKLEDAHGFAEDLLEAAENAIRERAKELGVPPP